MFSPVAYYLLILGVGLLLMHNLIILVKSQCTVHSCETGDSSVSIATEIRQMFAEFHERLQVIDRRSQEQDIYMKQVQSIQQILSTSVQQMSSFNDSLKQLQNQQDTVMTSLQRQDVSIKEVQVLLNASFHRMTDHNSSVLRRLDEVIKRLDNDISAENQMQNSWKLTTVTGVPLRPKTVTDVGNDSTLLPNLSNWTIIMNRFDGSVSFSRTWIEYKNGFGDIGFGEFWLGNEIVHRLTNRSGVVYTLRIEVQHNTTGGWYYADYSTFSLDSEASKYALRLSGFSGGNAGDSLINTSITSTVFLGGMKFSTWDNDESPGKCASHHNAGWWFNHCQHACLTCPYNGTQHRDFRWYSLSHLSKDGEGRLRAGRMMIRSK